MSICLLCLGWPPTPKPRIPISTPVFTLFPAIIKVKLHLVLLVAVETNPLESECPNVHFRREREDQEEGRDSLITLCPWTLPAFTPQIKLC